MGVTELLPQVPVFAEPGGTHDGRLDAMHRLIDAAADAGATAIKPQWTSAPARMVARRRAGDYYLGAYARIAYPIAWHGELRNHARDRGLAYIVSVYLPEDVGPIAPYADRLKVASFEAMDSEMHKALAAAGVENVIVSTGMLGLGAALAVGAIDHVGLLLHCTSAYPAPLGSLNLRAIRVLQERVDPRVAVGYSDHSCTTGSGMLAVAVGAEAVEVHFRLDDCATSNPDYETALTADQLRRYVRMIRDTEEMLGDGVKRAQDAEDAMARYRVLGDGTR